MSCFQQNLRNELLYNGIQLKEFAGKINIPYSTILSYVGEKARLPRVDIAVKIAQELGVSVEYLVSGNDSFYYISERKKKFLNDISCLPQNMQQHLFELVHDISENY